MFNVVKFVESEKNGLVIPLNNVNDRLQSMLEISSKSIKRLKKQMKEIGNQMMEEQKIIDETKKNKENETLQMISRLRHR